MLKATQGFLSVEFSGVGPDTHTAPSGHLPSEFKDAYTLRSTAGTMQFGYSLHDAVWAWSYALHDLIITQKRPPNTLSRDALGQDAVKKSIYKTDFYGASGHITFDQKTGDRTC